MTRIVWTESLREDLSPRAASAPPDAQSAWKRLHDAFASSREACDKGLDQPGCARDEMQAALALLASGTRPKDAPRRALGAVLSLLNALGRADPFVTLVAQTHGIAAATMAVVDAHGLRNEFKHPKQWLVREHSKAPFAWRALRGAALAHGEGEGIAVARDAWPSAPLSLKVVLSHAFSSAPDLAADTAREVAALPAGQRLIVAPVLASLRDASLLDGLLAHRMGAHPLVDAAMNLGEDALPAILAQWERPIFDRAHLARVTSCFEDERVAKIFVGELTKKTTQQTARDWLLRFPDLAAPALAEIARARSSLGTLASELLEQTRRKSQTHDEVPLAELPMVLADPPWMRSKPKRSLRVVSVPASTRREHAAVPPRVRAELIAQTAFRQFPDMPPEALAQYVARVREGAAGPTWWHERFLVPKSTVLELVRELGHNEHTGMYFPFQTVAVFGDDVVPAFTAWVEKTWQVSRVLGRSPVDDVLLAVDSHRLAAALLLMRDEPSASRVAWRYFSEHLEATLEGIIPLAVSERGAKRTAAETVLRRLAKRHGDAVRSAAARHGEEVAASVAEILAYDERWACPKSPPKMPPTWKPAGFTRPRLRLPDARALPIEAVERIGHMLAFSTPDDPYVGLEDVKAVCDPRSLAELAWDAARAWETTSGRTADAWMMDAIAHLGDDEVIRRTTPAIKHPHVIGVLGYAATDAAATELCTIRWRMTREAGRQRAHLASVDAAFEDLARRRGKSIGEIEDALSPATALPELRVKLDYGSRTIDVGFDERLDPFVEGPRGKLRELPKAAKKDDPEKVARAQEIWDEIQEDVAAIADTRLRSLERAMITGRAWPLEAFRHAWTDNALMRHLARGVVWRASRCFRVAEDGSFADVSDAAFEATEAIAVAHPAAMTDEEREAWRSVFFDYRITQPIDQLGRRILTTARGPSIALAPAAPLPLPELHRILRDAGYESTWRNREQVAYRACARSRHRTCITLVTEGKNVVRAPLSAELDGAPADLSEIDPIDVSEVLQDLPLALS